jgi:hypothetical protein
LELIFQGLGFGDRIQSEILDLEYSQITVTKSTAPSAGKAFSSFVEQGLIPTAD